MVASNRNDRHLAITAGLNPEQRAAVLHESGALCVLASAGSGKTRVITHRIARRLLQGTPPEGILALTFTNKAAGEMRERVVDLCNVDGVNSQSINSESGPWISTFHSFCARILRRHIHRIEPVGDDRDGDNHDDDNRGHAGRPYENSFTIYDTEDCRSLLKSILKELCVPNEILSPSEAIGLISRMKNFGNEDAYDLVGGSAVRVDHLTRAYEQYQRSLRQRNAVDFDDLLLLGVRLLAEHPDVLTRYQEQFHEVLVDEYQDTNAMQYQLARLLTQRRGNLCITGDPDQSIYRWRGADAENWAAFERDYPNAITLKLERNYRSTPRILAAANVLIMHNEFRTPKELWTEGDPGDPVVLRRYDDERYEARAVAERIMQLTAVGYRASDIAVFYRTNALSRTIEQELASRLIPYEIVGGVEFFGRREVKDLLAYLTLLVNPHEEESARRIINIPRRGIGEKSLQKLVLAARTAGMPLLDFILSGADSAEIRGKSARGVEQFAELIRELRDLSGVADGQPPAGVGVEAVIRHLVSATNYAEYLRQNFPGDARDRSDNVDELISAAREYDERGGQEGRPPGLLGFLEEARLVSTLDRWDAGDERVPLLTLHAAKGLEFPVVFIIGVEQGLLPLIRPSSEADIEEERRLFYVGITRARERLFISHTASRARAGFRRRSTPSQFLSDLCSPLDNGDTCAADGDGGDGRDDGEKDRKKEGNVCEGEIYEGEDRAATRSFLDVDELTKFTLQNVSTHRFVEREFPVSPEDESDIDGDPDFDYESESDSAFDFSQTEDPFPVGTRVYHDSYGEGRVELLSRAGRRVFVTVLFDCGTSKRFSLAHADLRSIPG